MRSDLLCRNFASFHRPFDGFNGLWNAGRKKQNVVSCLHSQSFHFTRLKIFGYALHIQGIRNDQSLKTQLLLQKISNQTVGQGCWNFGIALISGNLQVARHYSTQTILYQRTIGIQLQTIQTLFGKWNKRHSFMTIGIGISMTRKMFGTSQNSVLLKAIHKCHRIEQNSFPILSKRSIADNGVLGIVVDIHNRRKAKMNAHSFQLTGTFFSKFFNLIDISYCTQGHLAWIQNG